MREISAKAHGKVNLHLGVGDARPDGYHELVTVFQSLSLSDTLTLEVDDEDFVALSEGSIVVGLTVSGLDAASVPRDATNLAWRGVDTLVDYYRRVHGLTHLPRVRIRIHKGIPTAGGMAGGSADAAAALVATHALISETMPALAPEILDDLAAVLGSDVPFSLRGGTMLGTGRGERLTPMLSRGQYHWALVFSKEGLSTPQVFSRLDELRTQGHQLDPSIETADLAHALMTGQAGELAKHLINDLQGPATNLRPDIARTLERGQRAGALAAVVSGSGPTCALLCSSELHARDVLDDLLDEGFFSGTIAHGPAKGAHLINDLNN
ncbi:4-(cytidine 5'-diphospho)-2-C-methyl-D-erythritol kinase [Corynebacterium alimapuense]|uniref:4-diphosphocytidyl-2-C-methyl-D-erythritol kinase n=1 Tax=Corynebacterium alimapuense TaxID=1576874 RepID=A0A3M8K6S1_9CORY|nr:4-(cytidine 5'-diphospho)-2-C-methyl-D-erythritol kinase [Corynebacterium alimapuense]RNE48579.1 4-(cytidine 5'-diphospho)-2-C-methyl-D-erythritol kinase [Corynebacterium alimapuense]